MVPSPPPAQTSLAPPPPTPLSPSQALRGSRRSPPPPTRRTRCARPRRRHRRPWMARRLDLREPTRPRRLRARCVYIIYAWKPLPGADLLHRSLARAFVHSIEQGTELKSYSRNSAKDVRTSEM